MRSSSLTVTSPLWWHQLQSKFNVYESLLSSMLRFSRGLYSKEKLYLLQNKWNNDSLISHWAVGAPSLKKLLLLSGFHIFWLVNASGFRKLFNLLGSHNFLNTNYVFQKTPHRPAEDGLSYCFSPVLFHPNITRHIHLKSIGHVTLYV